MANVDGNLYGRGGSEEKGESYSRSRDSMKEKKCFCACHEYPGVYPTPPHDPCHHCNHVHSEGKSLGYRMGWIKVDAGVEDEMEFERVK